MYLGKPLIPAAADYLRERVQQARGTCQAAVAIDLTQKAAVVAWIRAQAAAGGSGPRLRDLPFASLPDSLRSDLDVACAVADVEPAALSRLAPAVLCDLTVARHAVEADPAAAAMFSDDLLSQLGVPRVSRTEVPAVSEYDRAMQEVSVRPLALAEFTMAIRNNPDVVELAARGDPAALAYASVHLWADPHFIAANLPASPEQAARVLSKLVSVHGDSGAAKLVSNRHVASLLATRVADAHLPPLTRAVIEQADDASRLRRHPLARTNKPSPFSES